MSENDPLGINTLITEIRQHSGRLNKLEALISSSLDVPVTESILIERTGINKRTLLTLRKDGKVRSYKVGKDVTYIPSEFRDDIRKLAV